MFLVKERDHLEDLDVDGRVILKLIIIIGASIWVSTGTRGDKIINFQIP